MSEKLKNLLDKSPINKKGQLNVSDVQEFLDTVLSLAQPISANDLSGIYFLLKNQSVVYIGQSHSVYYRIGVHISENIKDFDSCVILPIEDEQERKFRECQLINTFTPKYNGSTKEQGFVHISVISEMYNLTEGEIDAICFKQKVTRRGYTIIHLALFEKALTATRNTPVKKVVETIIQAPLFALP